MENKQLENIIQDYFAEVDNRDLDKCVDFFQEDATIKFQSGIFKGRQAIVDWHNDRFTAELRVLDVKIVDVQENRVKVHSCNH